MNTSWKGLKDTLLDLYRRCYEYDFKYRNYLESNHYLQSLEDYEHSFSERKPAPYIVSELIESLSDDGMNEQDKYILYYLLHIDSVLDCVPIIHKMLSIIDVDYEKKAETLRNSMNSFCENKNDLALFKRMMLDYNNLTSDNVH